MDKKEEIKQAIKSKGMTSRSWARIRGFEPEAVKTFFRRYTNSHNPPQTATLLNK